MTSRPNASDERAEQSGANPNLPRPENEEQLGQNLPPAGLCPVVGIGASAGGLDAFTRMLKHLPTSTGMGFVLIQHLDPSHESILAELLASHTNMPVEQAAQGTTVQPNRVYVIPPNTEMVIRQGVLILTPRAEDRGRHLPIDFFFCSLAEDQRSRSIGVILSGAASDGTIGLEAIKSEGGITFAQDSSASFNGMPRNAISAGVVDFVLPPEDIGRELGVVSNHSYLAIQNSIAQIEDGPVLQKILSLLHERTGVNFTHYKTPTIVRRLSRRMALNHIEKVESYLGLLEQRPTEIDGLLDDLLITVTEFFRDAATFDALEKSAFPAILKNRDPEQTIRVWVPGCASGKEVYSLAICLTEYLEKTQQRFPIQIFGTDVSERSIEAARTAKYPESISGTVPPERLKRFFMKLEDGYRVTESLRELCIFSVQDVTRDPPLSKMDLISCRNLLIYLGPVLQRRVMAIFSYALRPNGCLLLGSSESLGSLSEHFVALDAKHKIYRKNLQLPHPAFHLPAHIQVSNRSLKSQSAMRLGDASLLDRAADRMVLDQYAPSGFLVNAERQIIKFRGEVGHFLAPQAGDPDLDVLKLVREEIAAPLRSALEEVKSGDRIVRRDGIRTRSDGSFQLLNMVVQSIDDATGERHFLILFEQVPSSLQQTASPETAPIERTPQQQERENLLRDLSTTRSYMQGLVEDLRSANEEAQSSNEELQSTNEELQTAKEELQSSNEELTTTNEEMQSRNRELAQVNNDLINLLSSMRVPIVMLNSDLRIRRHTPVAERVLNIIPTDIGRPISDLKPRINVPDLEELLTSVVHSMEPLEREVQDQDGRWHALRIHPYRTTENRVEGAVLLLFDIDDLKQSMDEVRHARDYAQAILGTVREPLLILDHELCIQTANRAFFETFDLSPLEVQKRKIFEIDHGQWNLPKVSGLFDRLTQAEDSGIHDVEVEHDFERIGWRTFQLYARRLYRSNEAGLTLLAMEDITDRKRAAESKYRRLFEAAKDGIMVVDADTGEVNDVNPFFVELFGFSRTESIGKQFWNTQPLEEIDGVQAAFERLQREHVVRFPDVTLKTKDHRQIDVEVVANVYKEGPRRVAQFNIRDITQRKQFDRQLQQTAQLESLGLLAGGIAHDFNNLLAGILGNAGLALSEAPANSSYQGVLKDIVLASQRAADLTRQMLAYAGKGRFVVRPINLSEMVLDVIQLVRTSIPKSVDLDLELAKGLPSVEADAAQMQQVLMNLVINGAEAIGEGNKGRVRIATRLEEVTEEGIRGNAAASELSPGPYVCLEVVDNGSGMDEKTQARIFDPFFTTKFTGRGLGLASVQGIIRGHHGAIGVVSTPGQGSTFQVLLPAVSTAIAQSAPEPKPESLYGTGLILVIDDEDLVLRTTSAILEGHGYQVVTAANGDLGVQIVREKKDELALVILDLTMPAMGGEETFAEIKLVAPKLPIILSSGYDASQAISRFGEQALAGFIQKPGSVTTLLGTVKAALNQGRASS